MSDSVLPASADNIFIYKQQVEDLEANARELKHLHLESKIVARNSNTLSVPKAKIFTDPVDQMLYDFKLD
jgi:hypothetical protein